MDVTKEEAAEFDRIKAERDAKRALDAKPFTELTDSQKIDRLVEELRAMRHLNSRIYTLEERLITLEDHRHDTSTGELLFKKQWRNSSGGLVAANTRDRLA